MSTTIYKQLATKQDLSIGRGKVIQSRNGIDVELDKINLAEREDVKITFSTINEAINSTDIYEGYVLDIKPEAVRKNGTYDVVLASSVTPDTFRFIQCIGVPTLALVIRENGLLDLTKIGAKGDNSFDNSDVMLSVDVGFLPDGEYVVSSSADFSSKKFYTYNAIINSSNDSIQLIKLDNNFDRNFSRIGRKPEMIAHRGFRNLSTQNTMLALTSAISKGADSLECDVQISYDGTPMIFHDTTVDSLTDGTGNFKDLTEAQLRALNFDQLVGTIYAEERIPLFSDFLTYAKRRGVYIYPEIKGYRTQADIDLILAEIEAAGMEELCMLQSFNFADLTYVRERNSKIAIGFLGSGEPSTTTISTLSALGNGALLWQYGSMLSYPQYVSYCYERNVDIGVWTVDSVTDAAALLDIGVNKIMSDFNVLGGNK